MKVSPEKNTGSKISLIGNIHGENKNKNSIS